tara:strand:- start:504 stop:647 length:144 start_codon:yes stop_codon:yes gene_type:complete
MLDPFEGWKQYEENKLSNRITRWIYNRILTYPLFKILRANKYRGKND